jgi:ABC-type nitrate/sulfonate/bicarbonate transport system permease component
MPARPSSTVLGVVSLVGGFALWEASVRLFVRGDLIVVPPSAIWTTFVRLLVSGALATHLGVSGVEFAYGFALAIVVGIPLGIVMASSRTVHALLDPWVAAFNSTPRIALAPLLIVWLGIGVASKVALVFSSAVFPILINTLTGVRVIDAELVEAARAFGARPRDVFAKVLLPGAVPFIVAGLRLGVSRGIIGVVVGELLGSTAGIGYMLYTAGQTFDTAALFVGVVVIACFGVGSDVLLKWLETRLAPWRLSAESAAP